METVLSQTLPKMNEVREPEEQGLGRPGARRDNALIGQIADVADPGETQRSGSEAGAGRLRSASLL